MIDINLEAKASEIVSEMLKCTNGDEYRLLCNKLESLVNEKQDNKGQAKAA